MLLVLPELSCKQACKDQVTDEAVACLPQSLASFCMTCLQATRGTRYTLVFCIIMIAGYVVKVCHHFDLGLH